MVETADARESDDIGRSSGLGVGNSTGRGVTNRNVDAFGVVVLDVLAEQPSQMVLVENHDVVALA